MTTKRRARGKISRRRFLKAAGTALAAGATGAVPALSCRPSEKKSAAAKKTLRILQWSHFVPGYDAWFDGVYTKEWGAKNGTDVVVDHMSATEINARGAAEAAARKGHDLFLFISPPAAYENQVIDHKEIVNEVEKRHGEMIPLARKSTLNAKTGKYFAFSDSFVPDPGNYRIDLWSQVGYPNGPSTWEDLRDGGRRIREKTGNPIGLGLSQEMDSNMALRGLLWSFGGSVQDAEGRPALQSKETIAALEFMRALYKESMTPEVFTWDPASNNRMMLAGRASYVCNAISVTRTAEKENPELAKKIGLVPALQGPARRITAEHVMNCYVIWKFAENIDGAKQFLVDLVDVFPKVFQESEFYNFPCYPTTVPNLDQLLANDPKADPPGKYTALSGVLEWATNVGYPGYATAAIDEVFNTFVVPTMFARVAREELTPEAAVEAAHRDVERIFKKWA
jgi:multiple sugar transport system substrate-binding protein